MATVLTQDAVLHFLQSSGGSVKNSDLLAHFRSFIRDHADRDRNRELFKKFVNSVATVKQEDGASLVCLRKQFRGGGGSANPPQVSAGRVTEASPQRTDPVPTAQKPRPKPQPGQSGTRAPAGETARRTVLPAAGITINNNDVETSLNVKPPNSTSPLGVRSAAAPALNPVTDRTQTSSLSERPVQDQRPDGGQGRSGLGPLHGITPVAPPVRPYGETRSPVPLVPVVPVAPPVRPQGETRAQVPVVPVTPPVRPQGETRVQVPVVPVALPLRPQGETRAQVPVTPPVRPQGETRVQVPVTPPLRPQGETRAQVPVVPVTPPVRPHGETRVQVPVAPGVPVIPVEPVPPTHRRRQGRVQSEGGLLSSDSEIVPVRFRYRQSYKSAMSCDEDDDDEEEELPVRQRSGGAVWPASGPLTDTARIISTSSPCILDRPAPPPVSSPSSSSSAKQPPKIFIQDVEWDETLVSQVPGLLSSSEPGLEPVLGESASRRSRPSEAERYRPSPKPTPHQDPSAQPATARPPVEPRVQLSSSPSSSSSTSEARLSSDWPPPSSSRGRKDLQAQTAQTGQVPQIQDVLQRAQGTMLESVEHPASSKTAVSPWQQSAGLHDDQESAARAPRRSTAEADRVPQIQDVLQRAQGTKKEASAWNESAANLYDSQNVLHRSTGDLLDTGDEVESSEGSASTPRLRHRLALPRRLSREVRDRMCRSLGTDLDQIQDDVAGGSEAARLNRLHLISSSLSLRGNLSSSLSSCSTPPRCHSLLELDEGVEQKGGRRSLPAGAGASANQQEAHGGHIRQSLVPLEPREHSWYVKAAAGAWPDIYSLFRDDPSLLNKHDFISGFTVLHWIAKHGDHRVLNTLWYGVQKAGLAFTVDARSLCGYTPLHIAAIHSNKNIMRLLVKNFSADVKPRDMAGKRPWQYLGCTTTPDVFQLLGAPARAALQGTGISDLQQPQQSRRRRHHLSTASSGERPSIVAGVPKVKRSTSLAAFLKHKSLLPFHGQQSDAAL